MQPKLLLRYIFVTLVLLFVVLGIVPVSYAWLSGWDYRKQITLNPATSQDNYQVKVELTTSNFDYSKAEANGEDLRLCQTNDTSLDYWIETWNTSGASTIWVEVAASGTDTIYMYYGNSSASSVSNGENTFEFFDDFGDGTIGSQWNSTTRDCCLEQSGSFASTGDISITENVGNLEISGTAAVNTATEDSVTVGWLGKSVRGSNLISGDFIFETEVDYVSGHVDGGTTGYGLIIGMAVEVDKDNRVDASFRDLGGTAADGFTMNKEIADTFDNMANDSTFTPATGIHRLKLIRSGSDYTFYYDLTSINASESALADVYPVLHAIVRQPDDQIDAQFNFVFVREYASSESAATIGNEETQGAGLVTPFGLGVDIFEVIQ